MALNAVEEENIAAIKTWWDENGKALAAVAIIIFSGYGGWWFWSNSTASQSMHASDLYEEILTITREAPDGMINEADRERVLETAQQLRSEHSGTIYAKFAALFTAAQAVEVDDLATAESELQWILDNRRQGWFGEIDEALVLTTSLRLGRIILARGDPERALSLINGIDPKSYEPGFGELRGDIYLAMDRLVDARDAYIAAQESGSNSELLEMKLSNLPE
ncbi:MAG: tetratricopeptide repeat protein [Gammaproteobacteria bacterium]|nr:tetratricopeptide repeat protein [Gammaproteobacteria bacterium]MCY4357385.1 tetratricopeptide repeat protein [Gammaproteobacteria bacterium]